MKENKLLILSQEFAVEIIKIAQLCFYNIPEVQFVSAEGLDVYGSEVTKIINETKRAFNPVGVD